MKIEIDDNTEIIKELRDTLQNIQDRLEALEIILESIGKEWPKTKLVDTDPDFNRVNQGDQFFPANVHDLSVE